MLCGVALVALATIVACTGGDSSTGSTRAGKAGVRAPEDREKQSSTTRGRDASGTTTTGSATSTSDVGDWDGVHYDYGAIVRVEQGPAGVFIDFDRYQLYLDNGYVDAKQMKSEPIMVGNTDAPGLNENTEARRYRLAPSAELLRVDNLRATCSDHENPSAPVWVPFQAGSIPEFAIGQGLHQTALTFNDAGEVARVRVGEGC